MAGGSLCLELRSVVSGGMHGSAAAGEGVTTSPEVGKKTTTPPSDDEAGDEAGIEAAHGNKKARAGEEGAADDAEEDETAESGGDVPLDTTDGAGEQVKAAVDDDMSDVFASEDEPEDEARPLTPQFPHMAHPIPPHESPDVLFSSMF